MILSPNPYETAPELPDGSRWAQDGIFSHGSVAPGSSLTYNYGDYVIGDYVDPYSKLPPPPWYCTEDSEYVEPNVDVALTGEIAPFDLWNTITNPDGAETFHDRGDGTAPGRTTVTQGFVWGYLRQNAAVVTGKTPMWQLIPNIPSEVDIDIAVTNLGFIAAPDVIVVDRLPPGFSYKAGSFNINPTSIITEPDGTTVLQWDLGSMRGAIQTSDIEPTDYVHVFLSYTLVTPELAPDIRYFLPRVWIDKNNDGTTDSHSEKPLLETYFVNRAPVAQTNNPTINEGETAFLDGTSSYDPDEPYGDYITTYEWDINDDGTWDVTGPFITLDYGDNGLFPVGFRVTDSYGVSTSTTVDVTVLNVAPVAGVVADRQVTEVSLRVAGSKWSNVEMTLYEDDSAIGFIEVERWPGSPDANPSNGGPTIPILFSGGRTYRAVVTYDPYPDSGDLINGDQPNNGKDKKDNAGNPVWVVLASENRNATKIHHTFNTQQSMIRDSEHWNHVEPWEVELNDYMGNFSVRLTSSASDPGADDLDFLWEFDDGTVITNSYPNSGGVYPVSITDIVDYSGPASGVTLTVTDDDGGTDTTSISF